MNPDLDLAQCSLAATTCLNNHLRRATRSVSNLYDEALRPSGLRGTQFSLLVALALATPVTITALAEGMMMDRTTLSRNLKPLTRDGLVTVAAGDDQRQRVISITPAGATRLAAAFPLWQTAQQRMLDSLGIQEIENLVMSLATAVDMT